MPRMPPDAAKWPAQAELRDARVKVQHKSGNWGKCRKSKLDPHGAASVRVQWPANAWQLFNQKVLTQFSWFHN